MPVPDPFILRPAAIHPMPRDPEPGDVGGVPAHHPAALWRFAVPVHRKAEMLHRDEDVTRRLDAAEFVDGGIVSHLFPVEGLRRQGAPAHILIAPAPRHPGRSPDFARHPDPAASLQFRPTAVVIGGPAEGFIRKPSPPAVAGRPAPDGVGPPRGLQGHRRLPDIPIIHRLEPAAMHREFRVKQAVIARRGQHHRRAADWRLGLGRDRCGHLFAQPRRPFLVQPPLFLLQGHPVHRQLFLRNLLTQFLRFRLQFRDLPGDRRLAGRLRRFFVIPPVNLRFWFQRDRKRRSVGHYWFLPAPQDEQHQGRDSQRRKQETFHDNKADGVNQANTPAIRRNRVFNIHPLFGCLSPSLPSAVREPSPPLLPSPDLPDPHPPSRSLPSAFSGRRGTASAAR